MAVQLSESDAKLKEQLEKLNEQRQLLLARLETSSYERINEAEAESSTKRRSFRQKTNDQVKHLKKSAKDMIKIAGIEGTLGQRLLEVGETLPIHNKQSKYLSFVCKNSVVDMSSLSSDLQINVIGGTHTRMVLKKFLTVFGGEEGTENNIDDLNLPKTLQNIRKLKKIYINHIDKFEPRNDLERSIHDIYRYIIQQHVYRSFMLTTLYINSCSEQSINIKYWSYPFETYFGRNKDVFLQWGETKAVDCKDIALDFKIDLRILVDIEKKEYDVISAELAKSLSTHESKLYNDKLKLILISKCHLNNLLLSMPYIPKQKIKSIKLPLIQIMGLTCRIYAMSLIDKGVYLLEDVFSVTYPYNLISLEAGGLQKVIQAFSIIEDLINDIRDFHRYYSMDNSSKMNKLVTGKKASKTNIEDWISEVIWYGGLADDD